MSYYYNVKDWTQYHDGDIMPSGLYYVVADFTEVSNDGTAYKAYDALIVLQFNKYDLRYSACDSDIQYINNYDNVLCKYVRNGFLLPVSVESCKIKYFKKCTESYKRFKSNTRIKYKAKEIENLKKLNINVRTRQYV